MLKPVLFENISNSLMSLQASLRNKNESLNGCCRISFKIQGGKLITTHVTYTWHLWQFCGLNLDEELTEDDKKWHIMINSTKYLTFKTLFLYAWN